ncbi:uncharacterized protein METZ01_LOCUS354285, partial [marine metagenome]
MGLTSLYGDEAVVFKPMTAEKLNYLATLLGKIPCRVIHGKRLRRITGSAPFITTSIVCNLGFSNNPST